MNDFISLVLQKLNIYFLQYLKDNNIRRWFPVKNLSYEINNDVFEICY